MSKPYRGIAIAAVLSFFCGLFFCTGPAGGQEGPLKIIAPNGSEKYEIGSMIDILWSAKMIPGSVDILLKKNDWIVGEIANKIPAASRKFTWRAGMVKIGLAGPYDAYKIVIRTSDGKYQDESDAPFAILATALPAKTAGPASPAGERPRLVIAKTNSGTRWCFNKENVIQWNGNLPITVDLKIELLPASGSPVKVIVGSTPNNGRFAWNTSRDVLQVGEGTFKIRISAQDNSLSAESPSFRIGRDLVLTAPKGNAIWQKGSSYRIEWMNHCMQSSGLVKIDLLNADKALAQSIAADVPLNKMIDWTVPDQLDPGQYFIRLTTADNLLSVENPLTVEGPVLAQAVPPSITILQPASDEKWCLDESYPIRWTSTLPAESKLKIIWVSAEHGFMPLPAVDIPNSGSYTVTVQSQQGFPGPEVYRLKVSTLDDKVFAETKDLFIQKPLSIQAPKSQANWRKGAAYDIAWETGCNGLASAGGMRVELSDEKGNLVQTIASDHPVNEAFHWTVPLDLPAGNYSIRISTSDNRFKAEESLTISEEF